MDFLMALLSILMINMVLSGDNAVVIALASRRLPGDQQKKAIILGTVGAIILRVILTVVAVYLLKIPFLQLVGGILLVWIAVKLLSDEEGAENISESANIWEAIKTIIIADFVMSLDNVLGVAGAAHGNILLLALGLAISIPIIAAGSSIIMKLMEKVPVLVHAGAAILGWTAGQMILEDKFIHGLLNSAILTKAFPLALATAVLVIGWLRSRQFRMDRA